VRLRPGIAPAAWAPHAIERASRDGLRLRIATDTPPELEDVFVALLETQEAQP
jgi:DNA topoisomerase IB